MKQTKLPPGFDPGITYPAYLMRNRLLRSLKKYIPELGGELMDFGCGSKPYRHLFTVGNYTGVDFDNPGHSHRGEEIDVLYDGRTLPFPDSRFDSVFSSEVFEHIFNPEEILKEIHRVMKPGAKILLTCPFAISEHEVPNDYARYTSFALKHLFEKNGFSVIAYEKSGNHVETVFQLWIMYIHMHITPYVRKIPVVRSAFRFFAYTSLNISALFYSWLLPRRKDLYMNNIILCRKD
jgi:SAM-dependent methyltransferase